MAHRLILFSFFMMLSSTAFAMQTAWVKVDYISARILSAVEATGNLNEIDAGLALKPEKGWYTYWRMAGDSGLPTRINWQESINVKDVKTHWQAPKRFETFGMHSFGYDSEVLLPLTVIPETPGEAVSLSLAIQAVVCKEICVPQTMAAQLSIPAGDAVQGEEKYTLEKARKNLPVKGDKSTLKLEAAVLGKDSVVVTAWAKNGFDKPDVIVETPGSLLTRPPEVTIDGQDVKRAVFKVPAPDGLEDLTKELFGKSITVTLINRGNAVEKEFSF